MGDCCTVFLHHSPDYMLHSRHPAFHNVIKLILIQCGTEDRIKRSDFVTGIVSYMKKRINPESGGTAPEPLVLLLMQNVGQIDI